MPREIKVLLIEDNPGDARLVRELLKEAEPSIALNITDRLGRGLEKIESEKTDLVLLDLLLPDSKGLESFQKIRRSYPKIPVVILSGLHDQGNALEAVRSGAEDYLFKAEIDGHILSRTIRYALERHENFKKMDALTKELQTTNARLEKLVLLDPLTGLLNRRGFQQVLAALVSASKRDKSELFAILLDLDDFKSVNDRYGLVAGDAVLQSVAARLKGSLRNSDAVARIGGDEFMILLPQTRAAEAVKVAEKIRNSICENSIFGAQHSISITASLGLIPISDFVSLEELLSQSHNMLTRSKKRGKNRVSYDFAAKNGDSEPSLSGDLLKKIRGKGGLDAVLQPIFELETSEAIGYEVLIRSSIEGADDTHRLFQSAMEKGILTAVDYECLKVCAARAAAEDLEGMRKHLNIFPPTLLDLPVEKIVNAFTSKTRGEYCLELSDQQMVGDPALLVPVIQKLRQAGFVIAVEDIGFGYSSIETLVILEPDIIKIDKSGIEGAGNKAARIRVLKRLNNVASALGAGVIVEGIESLEDLEILEASEIPFVQGYLFGRPPK